jgi:alkanesulfonate monooxygenase SsuD/methylene tetrahydromethanopterin reductase-like flavin-dependent oxidoreductase (luciferase family)
MARLIDEIVAEAEACEANGWDGVFLTEHHQQPDGYLPNPLLMAGLVGMRTRRLKVGTCVLLLPLHHPVHVAEDCAVIDLATKGRLVLSIGAGYQALDYQAFGVPSKRPGARTEEALAIIRRAWTGEPFSFQGEFFRYENLRVTPAPYRRPGPPVWMASWTPPGLARAARVGDGWLADPVQSLPVIKGFAERYREECGKAGRTPFLALMRDAVIAESFEEAKAESGPTMYTHRFYFQNGAYVPDRYTKGIERADQLTFERAAEDRIIAGSPRDCLEQLERWKAEVRPDYLIVRFRQPGGPPHAKTLESIRRFGAEVIPKL